jgi:hypothetical protein
MVQPILIPDSAPLSVKIIVAVIVIAALFFAVRAYIRKGRR